MAFSKPTLPTRVARDNLSFRCEEKLDKWLDFGSAFAFKRYCSTHDKWDTMLSDDVQEFVTAETIYEFKAHDLDPFDIAQCFISPRLIALIQSRTLNMPSLRSKLSQRVISETIKLVIKATKLSMSEQHCHISATIDNPISTLAADGLSRLLLKLNNWPRELVNAFIMMEDWMNVLQQRRILHEYVNETKPGRRVYRRFKQTNSSSGDEDPFVVDLPSCEGKILLAHSYSILQMGGSMYLLTDALLLGIINKASEMFCALLYNFVQSGAILPEDHYSTVCDFYRQICAVLLKSPILSKDEITMSHENSVFTLLKGIEGLGAAMIIASEDRFAGWENTSLLATMWRELYNSKVVTERFIFNHPLGQVFLRMSTPQIADVIGTVKLFGHPAIEIRKGVQQLYERTHEDLAIDADAVRGGIGILKRDLCKSFTLKHKRFPNVILDDPNLDVRLRRLIETHVPFTTDEGSRQWSTVTPLQWATLELDKNAEFDPVDNQLPLIKDKALGLTRSQVFNMLLQDTETTEDGGEWDAFVYKGKDDWESNKEKYYAERVKILKNHKLKKYQVRDMLDELDTNEEERLKRKSQHKIRAEERRTLLSFLLAPNFSENFRNYLRHYENDPVWRQAVLNYLVIKLTAKELELKSMGRFFGASPAEERNRRVVQDKNVMNLMSSHFPDQLMTPDDLGIMKKLISFRYFADVYPHHALFQVSFDFSKWNNSMRAASIDVPAAAVLDKWFGRKLFGRTMEAYENMLVYLREPDYKRWWQGQHGGIEGLNQATWSLIFLGGIKHALESAGVQYQVTVKGDDVRAAIAVPEEQVVRRGGFDAVRDDIMERIQILCRQMGWQLNPQESFVSLTLIATSKQYQVRKSWLPAASKKIMKMMSLTNILFPTLEDLIGSIFSCAHSACSQATAIYPAYISATMVASLELIRAYGLSSLTCEKIVALLMWPQVLGGPGALPLQTFFVRGENDMLSVIVALYCAVLRYSNNGTLKALIRSIIATPVTRKPDPVLLLSDPYAIALDIPERPSSLLKRLIRKKLKDWVRNVDIQRLLTDKCEREKEMLILCLFSMSPYLGKVATAIWENSPFYLIEEVLAKFMESPTVVALFSSGQMTKESTFKAYHALTEILKAAKARWLFWKLRLDCPPANHGTFLKVDIQDWLNVGVCPTRIAYLIRNRCWGKDIVGVTYPSLATQCLVAPAGVLKGRHRNWKVDRICMQVEVKMERLEFQTNLMSHHYASRQRTKPWVGSQTSPKVTLPSVETRCHSPTLSKLMKLILMTRITSSMGDEIQNLLRQCIRALTSIDIEPLLGLAPQGDSGHTTHRLNINAYSMNTMPNYRHNILQLTEINRETMDQFKIDPRDRTINFAALHFYHAALCVLPLQTQEGLPWDYPRNLEVMFHPESYDDDNYIICEWCNRVVDDDVIVQFTKPPPPNLHKFCTYQLIGCSSFDEQMIRQGITEYLEKRIDTRLVMEERDPNDPQSREMAALAIIEQMRLASTTIHSVAKSMKYQRVPHGEVLTSCLANMGLSSVYKVSVVVLRCIPAITLYNCLIQVVFREFINETIGFSIDVAAAVVLTKAPWNNNLSYLFEQIIVASLVHRLAEGSVEAGYLPAGFTIKAGMQHSSHRLAQEFMKAHLPLFLRMCTGEQSIPVLKVYNQFQGDENIIDDMVQWRETMIKWVFRCLNQQSTYFNVLSNVMDHIQTQLLLEDIVWDREMYLTKRMWFEAVCQIYPQTVQNILNLMCETRLFNDHVERELRTVQTLDVVILSVMIFLDQYMGPGDFEVMEVGDVRTNVDYHVFYFNNPVEFIVNNEVGRGDELVAYQLLERIFPTFVIESLYDIMFDRIERSIEWHPNALNAWVRVTDLLRNMASHYMWARINPQSVEESERFLRSQGIHDYVAHFEENVRELTDQPGGRMRQRQDVMEQRFMNRCRLNTQLDHRIPNRTYGMPIGEVGVPFDRLRASLPHALTRNEYTAYSQIWVDPLEMKRCIGRNNTSLSKYMDLLHHLRLDGSGVFDVDNANLCMCLGDGIGGVTAYLLSRNDENLVIHNSLKIDYDTDRPLADSATNTPPLEVIDPYFHPSMRRRVIYSFTATGDLIQDGVVNALIEEGTAKGIPLSLITLDADINWEANDVDYHNLLFNSLYIAVMVMHRTTVCIFKTFCICERTLLKFLRAIYSLFEHVHIVRSGYTRQHSTEIFVVFQLPVDLMLARTHALLLRNYDTMYGYHVNANEIIASRIEVIANDLRSFRLRGESIRSLAFRDTVGMVVRMDGYILSLNAIMGWFQVLILPLDLDLCQIYITLTHECRTQIQTRYDILLNCLQNNGYAFLNSRRGNEVAGGWQHLRLEVLRITKVLTLQHCAATMVRYSSHFNFARVRNIRDEVYRGILQHFAGPIDKRQVRFIDRENSIWAVTMKYEDNLTLVIRTAMHKFLQIVGCNMVLIGIYNMPGQELTFDRVLRSFIGVTRLNQCCIHELANEDGLDEIDHILCTGKELSHTRWDNAPDARLPWVMGAPEEREQGRALRIMENNLVSVDEDMELEVRLGYAEPNTE